ncbi:SemiSWEET family transporter [Nanoarchaeota archaeon]
MTQDSTVTQHVHGRKRRKKKSTYLTTLDKTVLAVSIISPLSTLPQVAKIFIEQNAAGVSVLSWFAYMLAAVIWLLYGIAHKVKPIIISNTLWVILDFIVVVGALIYGAGY